MSDGLPSSHLFDRTRGNSNYAPASLARAAALGSVVGIALTANQVFDDYAATCGWAYDSGGHYRGQLWDWYVDRQSGIVLLRQDPDITTSTDFDQLMEMLAPDAYFSRGDNSQRS